MIQLSKTAAVLSVALCGALTMTVLAQEPDEPRPRRVPAARQKRPTPPPTDDQPSEPAPSPSERPATDFTTRGLSPEAIRSFRETPPSVATDGEEMLQPEASPAPGPPAAQARPATAKAAPRPEYVVEPPDLLLVEVLESLPGRPISGERLVRPDGRISLGFYGEIPVSGLTLPQIKERIVLHLRKFISDDILGLVNLDESGEMKRDADGRVVLIDPRETDRVFVDVTAYNSQHDYVLGDVAYPGSLPYTGGDTVLDMLQYAGGLLPSADRSRIRLIRSFPKGSPARVLPINYEEIAMGTDSSTNYAILPNDRIVVPRAASIRPEVGADRGAPAGENPAQDASASRASAARMSPNVEGSLYFNRKAYVPDQNPNADLEQRIDALEKKLDRLIELVRRNQPQPGGGPAYIPAEEPDHRSPFQAEPGRDASRETTPMPGMTVPSLRPGPQSPGPQRPGPMEPRPSGAVRPQPDRPGGSRPASSPDARGLPDLPESRSDILPPDTVPEP